MKVISSLIALVLILCNVGFTFAIPLQQVAEMEEVLDFYLAHEKKQKSIIEESSVEPFNDEAQFQEAIAMERNRVPLQANNLISYAWNCGVKEPKSSLKHGIKIRNKRYVRGVGKWTKRKLKYRVAKYNEELSPSLIDVHLQKALNLWKSHTNLDFEETLDPEKTDIEFSFLRGKHGDGFPFKSNVVAHAFYPIGRLKGLVHFNDAFRYIVFGDGNGSPIDTVAVHELGHTFGLAHSKVAGSVMNSGGFWNPRGGLHADDIAGIQSLYGKKRKVKKPRRRRPFVNICAKRFRFDAMHFDSRSEAVYGFKGRYFWKINDFGVLKGYPKRIKTLWKELPANFTASFRSKSTGHTYFFKGKLVWRYRKGKLVRGYPKPNSVFKIPSNIDAALQLGKGAPYVIKGKFVYEFSEFRRRVTGNRTRVRDIWPSAPLKIDAAMQWRNGKVYFFKKTNFWRFSGFGRTQGLRKFSGWKKFRGIKKRIGKRQPADSRKYWIGCKRLSRKLRG